MCIHSVLRECARVYLYGRTQFPPNNRHTSPELSSWGGEASTFAFATQFRAAHKQTDNGDDDVDSSSSGSGGDGPT